MKKEWRIKNSDFNEKSVVKRILSSRGIKSDDEIYEFTHPLETKLTPPEVFCDMQKAVERISQAIENNEKIIIYGDFDADGVTSTSILFKTLKFLNANVNYYIPDRDKEGHGLDQTSLVKLMTSENPKLIITVDCGISNVTEVNFINTFKRDIIITDHHEAPEVLPNAYAIINPKAPNALDENLSIKQIENLTSLAGCGVAFKVAQALLNKYGRVEYVFELLPFVAVGTVADIVPLIGENRYFVTKGLELISQEKHYGLKRLLESAGYNLQKGITSEAIAFGVAPRINASGRLGTVHDALKVLISDNNQEIECAVKSLNELNKVRQELCSQISAQAEDMLLKEGNKNPAIVLFNKDWHIGIIGIAASELVEKYYKPTFLMTYSEEKKQYRCSARGIDGLSLYEIISANSELFDGFGGHTLAAGLSFSEEKASFEQVKRALNETVKEMLNGKTLKPFIEVDAELNANDVTTDLIDELSTLEPFGASNPNPVFVMKNLKVIQKRLMGENNNHLRITAQKDNQEFNCIRWKMGDIALIKDDIFDIAFHPQINEYNGNISVQLIAEDFHSSVLEDENNFQNSDSSRTIKIYDHRKKSDILQQVNDYIKNSTKNIKIFAESKAITDKLSAYPYIKDKLFTRNTPEQCDVLMFFDYPADKETFDNLIEITTPNQIHFMKYDIKQYDEKEFLKTFIKMLRYANNNNYGEIDLLRCSSALGKSFETIITLLDLFEEVDFIEVFEKNYKYYKIKLNDINDLTPILQSEKYKELQELITECDNFQKKLMTEDLELLEI